MWWIIGTIILIVLLSTITPKKKANPNCKLCEGKGEIWWPGFDGLGDYWYDCECTKNEENV